VRSLAAAAAALLALIAVAATAQPAGDLVALQADRQQWIQDTLWCGVGNVQIKYQDISVRCDRVEVDLQTMVLRAEGNVVFDRGENRMACDRAEFDLERKVGTMWQVQAFFPPIYHFKGERVEKLDETHYRFSEGVFTSCNLDVGAPPWSLEIHEALVEVEGYGHFRGAALKAKGVPVFYLPRLVWPLKRDRAAGLLVPNIGYSDVYGAYLGNAVFVPIGRSVDTTFQLDLYSEGYVGVGDELRWAPAENARGELFTSFVRDPETDEWEWRVLGRHNQLFPGGYALHAEVIDYSDIDFFQRFERTFDYNTLRSLYSYVTFSRNWGPQAANLRADHRETFFEQSGGTSTVVLERRPEVEYRLRSTPIGGSPFYLQMVAVAGQLYADRTPTLRDSYTRLDLFPAVSLLVPGWPWLNVTPALGGRVTYYSKRYSEDRTTFEEEPIYRRYVTGGLSIVGPSFSRVWTGRQTKTKHLIEPRVDYQYVSDPGDPTQVPVFDERDSVLVTNRARFTLANRLFVKRGQGASREVGYLEFSQDYSFSGDLTFGNPALGLEPSKAGPFTVWLRVSPNQGTNIDARASIDAVTQNLTSTSLSGSIGGGLGNLGLTWYTSFNPITGSSVSSQTRVFAGIGPAAKPWRLEAQFAYDIERQELLEQRYLARWRGSCWTAYAEFRDYRIQPYPRRDYRVAIDFTGLGTFLDIHGSLGAAGGL
jgi:LPS-assembly protein